MMCILTCALLCIFEYTTSPSYIQIYNLVRNHIISNIGSGWHCSWYHRIWAEVGMVVSDDVAVDAITELKIYLILHI